MKQKVFNKSMKIEVGPHFLTRCNDRLGLSKLNKKQILDNLNTNMNSGYLIGNIKNSKFTTVFFPINGMILSLSPQKENGNYFTITIQRKYIRNISYKNETRIKWICMSDKMEELE